MFGTIVSVIKDKKTPGSDKTGGGFGFIRGDDEEFERFFHAKGVRRPLTFSTLHEGDRVEFEPEQHEKGERAVNVTRATTA